MTPYLPAEFRCAICCKALDLTVDLNTDELGLSVHEQCYVNRLLGQTNSKAAAQIKMPRVYIPGVPFFYALVRHARQLRSPFKNVGIDRARERSGRTHDAL
jgi:hypothetical protein